MEFCQSEKVGTLSIGRLPVADTEFPRGGGVNPPEGR